MTCYVLFAEPGNLFEGLHHTVDGAVHRAAALGALTMEDGKELFVDDVADILRNTATISFRCGSDDEMTHIRIERHGIFI